jgi:hypothetical protein
LTPEEAVIPTSSIRKTKPQTFVILRTTVHATTGGVYYHLAKIANANIATGRARSLCGLVTEYTVGKNSSRNT